MLSHPGVLSSLNGYLNKKSAVILQSVCRITKYYIKPKCYRTAVLKLDTSDLAKLQLFVHTDLDSAFFYDFNTAMNFLKIFRYNKKDYHLWNKQHWRLALTFVIYRYLVHEYTAECIEYSNEFLFYYIHQIDQEFIKSVYKCYHYHLENNIKLSILPFYELTEYININSLETLQHILYISQL